MRCSGLSVVAVSHSEGNSCDGEEVDIESRNSKTPAALRFVSKAERGRLVLDLRDGSNRGVWRWKQPVVLC
jgi:hypothetical protein